MNSVLGFITEAVNSVIVPALFTLSLVVFVWGTCKYFIEGEYNEVEKEKAKVMLMYGVVSFVVVSGIWYLFQHFVGTVPYDIPL